MKNTHFFITITIWVFFLFGCKTDLDINANLLEDEIYKPTVVEYPILEQSVVLYLDHSTCVIDANRNSSVFQALKGQLGLYTDTLCLVKGSNFEYIPNTDKSPTSTDVFNIINGISVDIPYADIGQAIANICAGSSQAVFITDCEYFDKDRKNQDGFPYLSGAFKDWIAKGHEIHIVTEPYQERYNGRLYNKKRFYFIFSNDNMRAPIHHNLLNEIQHSLQNGICTLFKLTNSDIAVQRVGDMFSDELDISHIVEKDGFLYVDINSDWNTIREFVMKLNKYGDPLGNDDGTGEAQPEPLIQNLYFNNGENYVITDVDVIATNITEQYLAIDDSTVAPNIMNIKDGFLIDKEALNKGELNVFVTEKVLNYLTSEYGGNLIRLDFIAKDAYIKAYNDDIFTWQSVYQAEKATCVSKSIENVLADISVLPFSSSRRMIYTVFLNTQSYK